MDTDEENFKDFQISEQYAIVHRCNKENYPIVKKDKPSRHQNQSATHLKANVDVHKNRVMKEELKECTFKPSINRKNQQQSIKNDSKEESKIPAYQRLYQLHFRGLGLSPKEYSFSPSISNKSRRIHRNEQVEQILYQDAMRRQHKAGHLPKFKQQKVTNLKTDRLVVDRFIKEVKSALEKFNLGNKRNIVLIDIHKVLFELGFITVPKASIDHIENQMVYEIYESLKGEHQSVSIRNLVIFLLAILGFCQVGSVLEEFEDPNQKFEERTYEGKYGILEFEKGVLLITQSVRTKIQRHFNKFIRNRLCKKFIKEGKGDSFQFKPKINRKSKHMAENYRQKIRRRDDEQINESCEISKVNQLQMYIQNISDNKTAKQIKPLNSWRTQELVQFNTYETHSSVSSRITQDKKELDSLLFDQKPTIKSPKISEDRPLFVMEVNLGDLVEEIVIFKHQAEHCDCVVQEFADKYSLDEASKEMLLKTMKAQLSKLEY